MKNINLQRGFAPLLIVAIIAILAIGGGAYVYTRNKEAKKVLPEDNLNTQANVNADVNANRNANLGINANVNAKGSLRSILGVGKNQVCTYTNTAGGATSTGTYYISTDGSMRGDFTIQTSAGSQTSSMLTKNGITYVWSGSQGTKMSAAMMNSPTNPNGNAGFDLDSQFGYNCENWPKDESKFSVPSSVNFVDMDAMMKFKTP